MFTGDEFADGGDFILKTLDSHNIKASFFLTGNFYRNPEFQNLIYSLKKKGHYLGAHSDQHLLYCAWEKRDSLLVTKKEFTSDLLKNYAELGKFGVKKKDVKYFLPPYEWYNDTISKWTSDLGLKLINFTPGTRSTADYTWPDLKNYRSSEEIYKSIMDFETLRTSGLNGFILLIHIGTDPRRTDKFYHRLPELLNWLKREGYAFKLIDQMLDKF